MKCSLFINQQTLHWNSKFAVPKKGHHIYTFSFGSSHSLQNWSSHHSTHSAPVVICALTDEVQASNIQSTTPDLNKMGSGTNLITISPYSLICSNKKFNVSTDCYLMSKLTSSMTVDWKRKFTPQVNCLRPRTDYNM